MGRYCEITLLQSKLVLRHDLDLGFPFVEVDRASDRDLLALQSGKSRSSRKLRILWNPAAKGLVWIFATKVDEGISFAAVSYCNHNAFDGDLLTDVLYGFSIGDR